MNKGGAIKDSKVREVRVAASERDEGDDTISIGPRTVSDEDHGQEGESPKAIGKRSNKKNNFSAVSQCSPLSFDTSKLPVGVGDSAFDRDVVRIREGAVKEELRRTESLSMRTQVGLKPKEAMEASMSEQAEGASDLTLMRTATMEVVA